MHKVLFLCTGNSCRSIMAEALLNELGAGRFVAQSAGSQPTGQVHPGALAMLARAGVPAGNPHSKSWDVLAGEHFDIVVTVCDQAAGESCPYFPGVSRKLHWSTPDPAKATGSAAEIAAAFTLAFTMLRERIAELIASHA